MQATAGVGDKRKRSEAMGDEDSENAQAASRARGFLAEFRALPLDKLPPAEGEAEARNLYQGLLSDAEEMPALKRLLTSAA